MVTVIKKNMRRSAVKKILARLKPVSGFDSYKYCGKVKLKEDPLVIQRRLRDEWR